MTKTYHLTNATRFMSPLPLELKLSVKIIDERIYAKNEEHFGNYQLDFRIGLQVRIQRAPDVNCDVCVYTLMLLRRYMEVIDGINVVS